MEGQGRRKSGGGGGTETTGEGEDEESSSSSSSTVLNTEKSSQPNLRPLLEDENGEQTKQQIDEGAIEETEKNPENELERFRQQWRDELQKVAASKGNSRSESPATIVPATVKRQRASPGKEIEKPNQITETGVLEQASRLFQNGIEFERRGEMHDAVRCYRQALFLVPDIEKRMLASSNGSGTGRTYAMVASEGIQNGTDNTATGGLSDLPSTERLVEIFRHRLFITNGGKSLCTPADPNENMENLEESNDGNVLKLVPEPNAGVHISQIPVEVLMHIFKWVISSELDLRQLEELSMVCCGFYIAARDPELWRMACLKVWGVRLGSLDSTYPTWRQMYIERPRPWYSGVYISRITYIRHGESSFQDQFYRPWHLVVYYRYLRFFADGTMLMLTTPDDPSSVVPGLKWKNPRFQGVLKGTYRLVGHDCVAGILIRKCNVESTSSPYVRNRVVKQPNDLMEHVFSLVFTINSVKRRHHTQLIWSNYEVTARYRNGQASGSKFDLCDQQFPPLYFSRVKSYTAYSEEPM